MKWRKFHELSHWDERLIARLDQGAKMRGHHSPEEWQRIFANHKSLPAAPPINVTLSDDTVYLHPLEQVGQLELGAIAEGLQLFHVTNGRNSFDPRLPFRLYPLIGWDAFTKGNSWCRRVWRAVMEVAREGQRYQDGWGVWRATLAQEPGRSYSVGELASIAQSAIGGTLSGQEAKDFWRAMR